jgi:hypothetical protein
MRIGNFFIISLVSALLVGCDAAPIVEPISAPPILPSALPIHLPISTSTQTEISPKSEVLAYGIKTVVSSMSDYDASLQNLPLYKYKQEFSRIYGYDVDRHAARPLFSDETTPAFILMSRNLYFSNLAISHGGVIIVREIGPMPFYNHQIIT